MRFAIYANGNKLFVHVGAVQRTYNLPGDIKSLGDLVAAYNTVANRAAVADDKPTAKPAQAPKAPAKPVPAKKAPAKPVVTATVTTDLIEEPADVADAPPWGTDEVPVLPVAQQPGVVAMRAARARIQAAVAESGE